MDLCNLLTEKEIEHLGVTIYKRARAVNKKINAMTKRYSEQFQHISSTDSASDVSSSSTPIATTFEQQVLSHTTKKRRKTAYLQCDFCGKQSVKVRHHAALSLNDGAATNFCRPDKRSENSRCLTNYCKWINCRSLSKGLPNIMQRKYADQLKSKTHFTDIACHYCGAVEEMETSTILVKVPTGAYDDSSSPKLNAMSYQMFCKDKKCLEQFVEFIQCLQQGTLHIIKRTPHIMKHVTLALS